MYTTVATVIYDGVLHGSRRYGQHHLLSPAAGMLSGLNIVASYAVSRELKPKTRQPQLIHFAIEGEKDPAAQAMARKSWEARRAKA